MATDLSVGNKRTGKREIPCGGGYRTIAVLMEKLQIKAWLVDIDALPSFLEARRRVLRFDPSTQLPNAARS